MLIYVLSASSERKKNKFVTHLDLSGFVLAEVHAFKTQE